MATIFWSPLLFILVLVFEFILGKIFIAVRAKRQKVSLLSLLSDNGKVKYFAYGSNMLTERLKPRCKSANPLGSAFVTGYKVLFIKGSNNYESGKATLVSTCNESDIVYGILFEIDNTEEEIGKLDDAEGVSDGGYIPKEDFTVVFEGKTMNNVRTYIAPKERCKDGLPVYDWYLAFAVAGAKQHQLDAEYISKMIETNITSKDPNKKRESKEKETLKNAGFEHIISELK